MESVRLVEEFIAAACVPIDAPHGSGTLDRADELLAAHPALPRQNIYAAAALGDDEAIRQHLARDLAAATSHGGPRSWDPLTCLCFSRYLRLDAARSDGFVRAALALLDAGADPNTGFYSVEHEPEPVFESAIYGAAGVAHHAGLTRLLLERGADPNDEETPYHAPETYDNRALSVLVESGRLSSDNLAIMLLRKTDWHDVEGVAWLLGQGVAPDAATRWGRTALHNAVMRDNSREIVAVLLDHGANPLRVAERPDRPDPPASRQTAVAIAARRGRGDLLALFEQRGVSTALAGADAMLAACARGDAAGAAAIGAREPDAAREIREHGGQSLADFAGNGNAEAVGCLLDLGIPVDAVHAEGDGYFGLAPGSTALHAAAWRSRPDVVRLLLQRGAEVNRLDGEGRSALELAVRACVDSYWTDRRTPESVAALLSAGAAPRDVRYPSGYAAVDELLARVLPA